MTRTIAHASSAALVAILGAASLPVAAQKASAPAATPADWRETYAYTLGTQAYVFAFPWALLSKIQYQWVVVPPKDPR